jgi:hypothetical protein
VSETYTDDDTEFAASAPLRPHEKLLDTAKRDIALADGVPAKLAAIADGAAALAIPMRHGGISRGDVVAELLEQALNCGLGDDPGEGVVIATISRGLNEGVAEGSNGHGPLINDAPPVFGPNDYGSVTTFPGTVPNVSGAVLKIEDWLSRYLPPPDLLLGSWLTTTSRVLFTADTGLGKTNFAKALGFAVAAGAPFLHWGARRAARVLYVDGEMSRLLLRQRISDAAKRLGTKPANFFALSHEDIDGFAPLNTPAGQACIEAIIKQIGGIDLAIFDSIMCLVAGDMKDEEPWQQTLPWVRSLTRRNIAQIWINHTGHDATRGYGTKTREWQMDTVLHADAVERADADVSFGLRFTKARERAPQTRADFEALP